MSLNRIQNYLNTLDGIKDYNSDQIKQLAVNLNNSPEKIDKLLNETSEDYKRMRVSYKKAVLRGMLADDPEQGLVDVAGRAMAMGAEGNIWAAGAITEGVGMAAQKTGSLTGIESLESFGKSIKETGSEIASDAEAASEISGESTGNYWLDMAKIAGASVTENLPFMITGGFLAGTAARYAKTIGKTTAAFRKYNKLARFVPTVGMSLSVAAKKMHELKHKYGYSYEKAAGLGAMYGAYEVIGELAGKPMDVLFGQSGQGLSYIKKMGKLLGAENLEEFTTETLNQITDYLHDEKYKNMSAWEFTKEIYGPAIVDTFVSTTMAVPLQGGAGHISQRVAEHYAGKGTMKNSPRMENISHPEGGKYINPEKTGIEDFYNMVDERELTIGAMDEELAALTENVVDADVISEGNLKNKLMRFNKQLNLNNLGDLTLIKAVREGEIADYIYENTKGLTKEEVGIFLNNNRPLVEEINILNNGTLNEYLDFYLKDANGEYLTVPPIIINSLDDVEYKSGDGIKKLSLNTKFNEVKTEDLIHLNRNINEAQNEKKVSEKEQGKSDKKTVEKTEDQITDSAEIIPIDTKAEDVISRKSFDPDKMLKDAETKIQIEKDDYQIDVDEGLVSQKEIDKFQEDQLVKLSNTKSNIENIKHFLSIKEGDDISTSKGSGTVTKLNDNSVEIKNNEGKTETIKIEDFKGKTEIKQLPVPKKEAVSEKTDVETTKIETEWDKELGLETEAKIDTPKKEKSLKTKLETKTGPKIIKSKRKEGSKGKAYQATLREDNTIEITGYDKLKKVATKEIGKDFYIQAPDKIDFLKKIYNLEEKINPDMEKDLKGMESAINDLLSKELAKKEPIKKIEEPSKKESVKKSKGEKNVPKPEQVKNPEEIKKPREEQKGIDDDGFKHSGKEGAGTDRTVGGGPDTKSTPIDRKRTEIGTLGNPEKYVKTNVGELLKEGEKFGIPEKIIKEQLDDTARAMKAYEEKKPMFLLANEAGTGKSFVLGAIIQELKNRGNKKIFYVTMNKELITQLKKDLKKFDIDGVEFLTYAGLKNIDPESSDVIVFDEAHNLKNMTTIRGKKGKGFIDKTKFTVFASATPFENPTEAAYLEATGIFPNGFWQWAISHGATKVKFKDKTFLRWNGTEQQGINAREELIEKGVMTQRDMQLPLNSVDIKVTPVKVSKKYTTLYNSITKGFENVLSLMRGLSKGQLSGYGVNLRKRILESSKIEKGIELAKKAIAEGKNPVIFIETKAERKIEAEELINAYEAWANMPKKLRGNPPCAKVTYSAAKIIFSAGYNVLEIPSTQEQIVKALGKDNVAVYTGAISNAKANQNLEEWRSGKKKVIVATMAKGGTGLSLHDTVGDHPTVQININLPWKATGVAQVSGRTARYGLKSNAEINWVFAENIDFDTELSLRVSKRMEEMGAVLKGEKSTLSEQIKARAEGKEIPVKPKQKPKKEVKKKEAEVKETKKITLKRKHGSSKKGMTKFDDPSRVPLEERYDLGEGVYGQATYLDDEESRWTKGKYSGYNTFNQIYDVKATIEKPLIIKPNDNSIKKFISLLKKTPQLKPSGIIRGTELEKTFKKEGYDGVHIEGFSDNDKDIDKYSEMISKAIAGMSKYEASSFLQDQTVLYNPQKQAEIIIAEETKTSEKKTIKKQEKTLPPVIGKTVSGNVQIGQVQGIKVKTRFRIVEASDTRPSHSRDGVKLPDVRPEFQNRIKDRASNVKMYDTIHGDKFEPNSLGHSGGNLEVGAPVVSVIDKKIFFESGNTRGVVLKDLYSESGDISKEKIERYKQFLKDNAESFGFDADDVSGFKEPVLVKERITEMNDKEFKAWVDALNTPAQAPMSAVEMIENVKDNPWVKKVVDTLRKHETLKSLENIGQIDGLASAFANLFTGTNRGKFVTASGKNLTAEGFNILKGIIFKKAFKDNKFTEGALEGSKYDSEEKKGFVNIYNALEQLSPALAKLNIDVENNIVDELDFAEDLVRAFNHVKEAVKHASELDKPIKQNLIDWHGRQMDMFSPTLPKESILSLAKFLYANKTSEKNLKNFIMDYINTTRELGFKEGGLFGEKKEVQRKEVLDEVLRRSEKAIKKAKEEADRKKEAKSKQRGLFDQKDDNKKSDGKYSITGVRDSLKKTETKKDKYSVPTKGLDWVNKFTSNDVRKIFPDTKVIRTLNGFKVYLPNKEIITIRLKDKIDINEETLRRDRPELTDEQIKRHLKIGASGKANFELSGNALIQLAKDISDNETLSHEAFHIAYGLSLTKTEKAILGKKYGTEENIADAFEKWQPLTKEELETKEKEERSKKFENKIFGKIRLYFSELIERVKNRLIKKKIIKEVDAYSLFDDLYSGRIWAKETLEQTWRREQGFENKYQLRTKKPPVKTIKAYKLMRVKKSQPGKLFPLFVNAEKETPVGLWLDAEVGEKAKDSKTGKKKVKSKLGDLAYRPGWHLGNSPGAFHIGKKNKEGIIDRQHPDTVWVETEVAADVNWQERANENGKNKNGKVIPKNADLKEIPVDGYYRYKTNPNMKGDWIITGSIKLNKILSDQEVDKILSTKKIKPLPRDGGPIDLKEYGFNKVEDNSKYQLPNIAYHAGDLGFGRDTVLSSMEHSRSTGHYGTGVYFFGNEGSIRGVHKERPLHKIDLTKYNLFKPRNEDAGFDLHEGLKYINRMVFISDKKIDSEDDLTSYLHRASSYLFDADTFKFHTNRTIPIIKKVVREAKKDLNKTGFVDSASTRFMKAFGYDGVDVRSIELLDNSTYGSVIYKEKLQTKKDFKDKYQLPPLDENGNVIPGENQIKSELEMPMLVNMIYELTGKYPKMKEKLRKALGTLNAKTKDIEILASLFKEPKKAMKTIAHELGHLIDDVPDGLKKRGNILGRIASAKEYMKDTLANHPGALMTALSKEDKARIKVQAEQILKDEIEGNESWYEIWETVEKEFPVFKEIGIIPKDILSIWNDNESREKHPKLYERIAKMSTSEKKSIMIETMKGISSESLKDLRKKEQVGTKITKVAIMKKYKNLLKKEISKRMLFERQVIMKELKDLTQWWKPFDVKKDKAFTRIRHSSAELYADALSVMLHSVDAAKEKAPTFVKAFFNFLENKPNVSKSMDELFKKMNLSSNQRYDMYNKSLEESFKEGEEEYKKREIKKEELRENRKESWADSFNRGFIDKYHHILKKVKLLEKAKKLHPSENPKYLLEEYNYISGKGNKFINMIQNHVVDPVEKNGLSQVDIGKVLKLERDAYDENIVATPGAFTPDIARRQLKILYDRMGPKKAQALKMAVANFRKIHSEVLNKAYDAGLYTDEQYEGMKKNEFYSTTAVIDYIISNHVTHNNYKRIGTFKKGASSFSATIDKLIAIQMATEKNKAKNSIISMLNTHFSDEIEAAETKKVKGYIEVGYKTKDGFTNMGRYEEGKWVEYHVDPFIADAMEITTSNKMDAVSRVFRFMNSELYKKAFVLFSPGFHFWNLQRDFRRAWKASNRISPFALLSDYRKAWKEFSNKDHSKIVDEMKEHGMWSASLYGDLKEHIADDKTYFDTMSRKFQVKDAKTKLSLFKKGIKKWENIAERLEMVPKIAGYIELKNKKDLTIQEIAHQVRVFRGSPDFFRKGEYYNTYNNLILFGNAIKEGMRGDIEMMKEPNTRSGYWTKTIIVDILPKIAMMAALKGLFDDDDEKDETKQISYAMSKMSEYDLTNYTNLPLWTNKEKELAFLRFPHDEIGRFIGGVFWKILNMFATPEKRNLEGVGEAVSNVVSLTGGQLPSTHPLYETIYGLTNGYDLFKGRDILTPKEKARGGWAATEKMFHWVLSKQGLSWGTYVKDKDSTVTTTIKRTPVLNRLLKITNYGLTEKMKVDQATLKKERLIILEKKKTGENVSKEISNYHLKRSKMIKKHSSYFKENELNPNLFFFKIKTKKRRRLF